MADYSSNQNTKINDEGYKQVDVSTFSEKGNYSKLRRTALISTIVLIIVILITLLYLNGKSLYEHGL